MGTVVEFPEMRRSTRTGNVQRASATIIILPVIRIERQSDEPSDSGATQSARKRRRRATRS